jgi:hypothetical protein
MLKRRSFLHASLCGGVSLVTLPRVSRLFAQTSPRTELEYELSRDVPTRRYDGRQCWCHPRAGIVPAAGRDGAPRVVMTVNTLDVAGSDVFKGVFGLHTDDLGASWTEPRAVESLAPRWETIDGQRRPVALSDAWPTWHRATSKLLATGHTVVYTPDWRVTHPRPRHTAYATYEPGQDQWTAWRKLAMPDTETFHDAGAGCVQRFDEADGSILLPMYFRPPGENSRVTVTRCTFDGRELKYQEHGNVLAIDDGTRGLHEPSLTRFGDRYFLTLRNDKRGYVTCSADGLQFQPYQPWQFDDGTELGNYNTQQHWVTHSDGLFLVYTRRGADNDHVFRHRAPLFLARVDPQRLCVIRASEQILVPERGARLGNFGVTRVSPDETWVTVAEWMQTWGPNHILPVDNQYGSDGSVWVARIHWSTPNRQA